MEVEDYIMLEWWFRNRDKITWTIENGQEIPISKLTDDYLDNIVKHLNDYDEKTERVFCYEELGSDW